MVMKDVSGKMNAEEVGRGEESSLNVNKGPQG